MNLTVILSEIQLPILMLIFFSGLGYLNGWLMREIGVLKIIALIILLTASLKQLVSLNQVFLATIPFLLFMWFGYYGIRNTYQYLKRLKG